MISGKGGKQRVLAFVIQHLESYPSTHAYWDAFTATESQHWSKYLQLHPILGLIDTYISIT